MGRMTDVVVIVVDALRPDAVGHLDSPGNPTPTIDNLASDGLTFEQAYAAINTTDPSITSIHSGQFPDTTGLRAHGQQVYQTDLDGLRKHMLLPERLSKEGYETGAVDWLGRWHRRGFDYYTGSERLHDYSESIDDQRKCLDRIVDMINGRREYIPTPIYNLAQSAYRRFVSPVGAKTSVEDAKTTTDQAISILNELNSPRYLFVHYWDVHAPYETPSRYTADAVVPDLSVSGDIVMEQLARIENDDRRAYIQEILDNGINNALAQYYGAVSYVDDQISRLIKYLDDALVLLMADHGESLVEHGIFFEHHGLYEVNTRVPLIISGTGIPKKTVSDGFVQLPDVYPTVLGHLNLEYPPVDGIDIISRLTQKKPLRSEVYFEEAQTQRAWGVRTDTHRYIRADGIPTCKYCEIPHYDGAELYNLNDDIDEKKNIINSRQGIAADLHKRMVSFFSRVNASEKKLSRRAIDSLIDVHGSRL